METIGLLANVAALILAVIAIWMSLHFYHKGKDTEKNVEIALAEIKAQTETLQQITGRQMDKLIDASSPERWMPPVAELVDRIQERRFSVSTREPSGDVSDEALEATYFAWLQCKKTALITAIAHGMVRKPAGLFRAMHDEALANSNVLEQRLDNWRQNLKTKGMLEEYERNKREFGGALHALGVSVIRRDAQGANEATNEKP